MTLGHSPRSQGDEPGVGNERSVPAWGGEAGVGTDFALRLFSGGILFPHPQRKKKKKKREILVLIGRWKDRCWIVRNIANVSSPGGLKYCHLSDFFVAFTTIFRDRKTSIVL